MNEFVIHISGGNLKPFKKTLQTKQAKFINGTREYPPRKENDDFKYQEERVVNHKDITVFRFEQAYPLEFPSLENIYARDTEEDKVIGTLQYKKWGVYFDYESHYVDIEKHDMFIKISTLITIPKKWGKYVGLKYGVNVSVAYIDFNDGTYNVYDCRDDTVVSKDIKPEHLVEISADEIKVKGELLDFCEYYGLQLSY